MAYAVNRCVQEKRREANRKQETNGFDTNTLDISDTDCQYQSSISVQDLESKMMLAHSPPLDILVRTSGVCRLSDFMLWQVSE